MLTNLMFGKLFFVVCVFFVVSRGVLEVLIGKGPAYVIQLLFSVVLFSFFLIKGKALFFIKERKLFVIFLFIFINFFSYFYTLSITGYAFGIIYFAVMMTWVFYYLCVVDNSYSLSGGLFRFTFFFCGLSLFIVAVLQQYFDYHLLPGISWFGILIRPSSLTGSYLHYPIVIAMLGLALLQNAQGLLQKSVSIVFILAPALAYSRSGMLIVVIAFFYYFYRLLLNAGFLKIISFTIFSALFLVAIVFFFPDVADRMVSMTDTSDSGNSSRIIIWLSVLSDLRVMDIFAGKGYGIYTNATTNFSGGDVILVTESSLLQQILNVGMIGTCVFYFIMISVFFSVHKEHVFLRAIVIAFILQGFVYQSIEVFPAFTLLFLLPIFSNSLKRNSYL